MKSRRQLVPQLRCSMTKKSGLWSWDWSQLMVGEEWPMWMIKWVEKAGLRWDRTGNVQKKTGGDQKQVTWLAVTTVRSVSACLFAGTLRPLVHVITTLFYAAPIICHQRVWHRVLSLCCVCIRSSGINLGCFVPNVVSFAASIAELAHGEKSHTQSIKQSLTRLIWCPGNWSAYASEFVPKAVVQCIVLRGSSGLDALLTSDGKFERKKKRRVMPSSSSSSVEA